MDDGTRSGRSLKLCTNNFSYLENIRLKTLLNKLNLQISIHKTGVKGQYNLYIHKKSKKELNNLILNYIHPSMKYKLNL